MPNKHKKMDWNWDAYFEAIEDWESFSEAVSNNASYQDKAVTLRNVSGMELPSNFIYSPWSNIFFELSLSDKSVSIDKKYLKKFLLDHQTAVAFKRTDQTGSEYIGYDFLLQLNLARNAAAGTATYKKQLQKLQQLTEERGVSLQGEEVISTVDQLNQALKDKLQGFTTVVEELG